MTGPANSLNDPRVAQMLQRLRQAAEGDKAHFRRIKWRAFRGKLMAKSREQAITPDTMKELYIPVSAEQGRFLYLTARAIGARNMVEFGTSFGISTHYLAAAARHERLRLRHHRPRRRLRIFGPGLRSAQGHE